MTKAAPKKIGLNYDNDALNGLSELVGNWVRKCECIEPPMLKRKTMIDDVSTLKN